MTRRCLVEDLGEDPDTRVSEAAERHAAVRKFCEMRSEKPTGQETIRSVKSRPDVFSLHVGELRAATWHDREYDVVWLLGCGLHREGSRKDPYEQFKRLDAVDRLLPDAADYEALFVERDAELVPVMVLDLQALLELARSEPGQLHSAVVGEGLLVTLLVETISFDEAGLEELWFAVATRYLEAGWLNVIRAALLPEAEMTTWEYVDHMPDRQRRAGEICFRHIHDFSESDV